MTERTKVKPILFSGPTIRALLDGRKTQTRWVLKPQPTGVNRIGIRWPDGVLDCDGQRLHFRPGDLLWVGETWSGDYWLKDAPPSERLQICAQVAHVPKTPRTWYWADGNPDYGDWEKPRPSIHMPRWASRLTLEVTAVKAERLQEISDVDAAAEGMQRPFVTLDRQDWPAFMSPVDAFAHLWNSLNAKRGFGWEANPWVCAIAFRVHKMNVDAFLAKREAA